MASLSGKVAIVTGASRGIGRAIAERLATEGASVVVNYAQGADKAEEVVSAVIALGGQALVVQADLSKVVDVRRLFQETTEQFNKCSKNQNTIEGLMRYQNAHCCQE